jgi:uncharacterized protein
MNWREAVIAYIRANARPVDKFDHQPRLHALTKQIGDRLQYDDDVVFAAVWLHDIGVFVGHRPEDPAELARWDNVAYAIEKAPGLLAEFGFPESKITAVLEAIRTHQPHAMPTTIEGAILRDADILEQLGTVAVVRVLAKIGRDTRYPTHHEAVPVLQSALRDLPGMIQLDSAKRLAVPKIQALAGFLTALKGEL